MKKTLYLYIWKEILPIFFIGLMTFTIRSYGFVFSILVLLAYYISLIAFEMLAVRRAVPAFLAGWSPTFILEGLGSLPSD